MLIKNGIVVNADEAVKADVLCKNGKIVSVGDVKEIPENCEVIDAGGKYVIPGGIDPHTHMQLPMMGTVASDDYYTGTVAAAAGGTTTIIDFVCPVRGDSLIKSLDTCLEWAKPSVIDYSHHVTVNCWSEEFAREMEILVKEKGVNSFKFFTAYRNVNFLEDWELLEAFEKCKELGALPQVHAENGDTVAHNQKKLLAKGITGPEAHPLSRPPEVEGEATNRVICLAKNVGLPIYIVHVSCRDAAEAIANARQKGQMVFGETLPDFLVLDDSVYRNKDWDFAASHVMSPPFRPKGHSEYLWNCLQSGSMQTTGTDHCVFTVEQKRLGRDDFTKIPNGCGCIQERMEILWHHGVNAGRFTPSDFVALTSANSARIFNIYPQKGCIKAGADADIVIWNPEKERTISAKTHFQNNDFSLFEGMKIKGSPDYTISRGEVIVKNGTFVGEKGRGRYINRPPFSPYFDAVAKRDVKPKAVER